MPEHRVCYPVDPSGFVRQCAWCRQIADERGTYSLAAPALLLGKGITHGCCNHCRGRLEAEVRQREVA